MEREPTRGGPTAADAHAFGDDRLRATVAARGAELQSIADARFGEVLWGAGPEWPRHAPVLFPIIGRLNGDGLRVGGRAYSMGQHGFARDSQFDWIDRSAAGCRLALCDDALTRAAFPFPFRLELAYAVADGALTATYRLSNPAEAPLAASLGAHPAFRWPLAAGVPAEAHAVVFAEDEPEPVRRLRDGLLDPRPRPTPVRGRRLALDRALFAEDALILDRPRSRALRYRAPGAFALELSWRGFRELGLWSKPHGDFLCLEPWCGHADPVGFEGDFAAKPGLIHLPPGGVHTASWTVRAVADG